jgi:hypothetical protein
MAWSLSQVLHEIRFANPGNLFTRVAVQFYLVFGCGMEA